MDPVYISDPMTYPEDKSLDLVYIGKTLFSILSDQTKTVKAINYSIYYMVL